jgi:ribosomal protein L40E
VKYDIENIQTFFTNNVHNNLLILQMILDNDYTHCQDINMSCDEITEISKIIASNIKKKISSYKQQDKLNINKHKHEQTYIDLYKCDIITYNETINKIMNSKLVCMYCNNTINIFYKMKREPTQWTLERTNNSIGHSNNNTTIVCLKCNVQRKNSNIDGFIFTKTLNINKI